MIRLTNIFRPAQPVLRRISWADAVVVLGLAAIVWALTSFAASAPHAIKAPDIQLAPSYLPLYAAFSISRMLEAYILSIIFSLIYGYFAASDKAKERVLLPILDILQSVPILAYLPVVVLSLTAILPLTIAKELAAVLLIFTSQAWNLAFTWYQSLSTIPKELREASSIFQMSPWMRLKTVQLPFAAMGLVWNSVMSWAAGWFALMASETFTIGKNHYGLPGIGSYIQKAAQLEDKKAILYGVLTLVAVIVALDQFVWRPLLAYSDRFRLDMVSANEPISSWVHDSLTFSTLTRKFRRKVIRPVSEKIDNRLARLFPAKLEFPAPPKPSVISKAALPLVVVAMLFGLYEVVMFLSHVRASQWGEILVGLVVTMLRVLLALSIALAWTIPVGVAIGTNEKLARILQPVTQLAASFPATAIYPLFLIGLLNVHGGLEIAAMLLMLAGTQWYLLFNVIAGAQAIPQDLKYTAQLMRLTKWEKWKTFILPALFPYIATGAITASGGAWNASIFAEYTQFGDRKFSTSYGIGALVARSQDQNDYAMLMAATLAMVGAVIIINRLVWKRMYRIAEENYRME